MLDRDAISLSEIRAFLQEHPQYANEVKHLAIAAGGFSYDFEQNGEAELIKKFTQLRPTVVFDVGANVGSWTAYALQYFPEAAVHAFELSPRTFVTLSGKIQSANAHLNNFGLSDRTEDVQFKDYGLNSTVNTLLTSVTYHDHYLPHELAVSSVMRGDDYCRERGITAIDMLKVDVEGAESSVLMGFTDMFAGAKIRLIQFEYGYANGDAHFLMRDFFQFFNRFGYVVGRLVSGPIEFRPWHYPDNDFLSGPNWVAVRDDDHSLKNILASRV